MYPVVLLVIRVGAEDLFYRSIRVLSLSVSLRVETRREARVDTKLSAQLIIEGRDKLSASVRDNNIRESIVALHIA